MQKDAFLMWSKRAQKKHERVNLHDKVSLHSFNKFRIYILKQYYSRSSLYDDYLSYSNFKNLKIFYT